MSSNKDVDTKSESDKYMSTVKVGPKGQIVIPKEVRDMFGIQTGDKLALFADIKQGIAVQKYELYEEVFNQVFHAKKNSEDGK